MSQASYPYDIYYSNGQKQRVWARDNSQARKIGSVYGWKITYALRVYPARKETSQ